MTSPPPCDLPHKSAAHLRLYTLLLPLLGLLLTLGAGMIIWYMDREISRQNRNIAIEDAANFARAVTQFRNFYSAEIVPRARDSGMRITHTYRQLPNALPLPATFTLDFGDYLSSQREGFGVRLFSDLPFPWRRDQLRLDDFQKEAIATFSAQPAQPAQPVRPDVLFYRIELINGNRVLRYAVADRMQESCVSCHNTYPGSPKTDWKVGDLRGVLEIRRPMTAAEASLKSGIRNAAYLSAGMISMILLLLWLTLSGLRRSMRETESSNLRLRAEIHQREQAQNELQINEGKLRALFDNILEAVVVIDASGRIVQTNRVACEMFGYDSDELLGQNVKMLIPQEHARQHDQYIARYLRTGESHIIGAVRTVEGLRRNGRRFPVQLAVSHVEVDAQIFFAGVIVDITARIENERALRAARDEALESARLKSEFLANMSHEIRSPMNGVIGMNSLLLDTPLTDEQRSLAETVRKSSEALLTIINDILDFSRIEAGKLQFECVDFDPVSTVEDVLELFSEPAADKGLELGYTLLSPVPGRVAGDEGRFRQVLGNLVGNAIKFTGSGQVEVSIGAAQAAPPRLEIAVRDTGIGIPEDKQHLLFESFSQIDGSVTRQFGGTGLGLAISRQLVELMGGEIGVISRAGEGSTFRFTVAFEPGADDLAPAVALPDGFLLLYLGGGRLLPEQLTGWGCAVTACRDAAAAVDALAARAYDLVVIDMTRDGAPVHRLGVLRDACARRSLPLPALALLARRGQPLDEGPELAALPKLYVPLRRAALAALIRPIAVTAAPDVAGPGEASALTFAGRRVLVVEDSEVNQMLITALLKKLNLEVEIAEDGEQGLKRMAEGGWDLVLMDCQMPVLDGFTATRRWREREAARGAGRLTVVALTANAMEGDRERCLAAGMDDYLTKPINRARLMEKLNCWLSPTRIERF